MFGEIQEAMVEWIYLGKCKDLGLQKKQEQKERFMQGLKDCLLKWRMVLNQQMISKNAMIALNKVMLSGEICQLDLRKNPIGLEGIEELAKCIWVTKSLVHLEMGSTAMNDA